MITYFTKIRVTNNLELRGLHGPNLENSIQNVVHLMTTTTKEGFLVFYK
jgi:hypothetical protein